MPLQYNRSAMIRVLVAAALAAGCNPYGDGWSYACSASSQCSANGICVDSHCAFVDTACASGYRFEPLSGQLAGQCWIPADGGTDDGMDGGTGCLPSYLVCDGFETPTLDPRWFSDGQVVRDTSTMHRGNASLHLYTNGLAMGTGTSSRIWEQTTLAGAPASFWARGWFRISRIPEPSVNAVVLLTADNQSTTGDMVFIRAIDDLLMGSDFASQGSTGGHLPTNTWFCLIWHVDRSTTATGSLELSGDQFPAFSLPNVITDDGASPIANLRFGLLWRSMEVVVAQPAVDLWIDDIITSTTPVSCLD